MKLSLIIPARNEEQRLLGCIDLYSQALEAHYGACFEILVMANGCTDRTVEVAISAAQKRSYIRVYDIPEAAGKGAAVLEGFRKARGQYVLFADADASTSADSLLDLALLLEKYDIAIGSRRLANSVTLQEQPRLRRICSTLFLHVVRFLFQLPYRDTQCGAKALRHDAAQTLAACVQEKRWAFDVDLLLTARALGLQVVEAPVVWTNDGKSGLKLLPTAIEIVRSLRRIRRSHANKTVTSVFPSAEVQGLLVHEVETMRS